MDVLPLLPSRYSRLVGPCRRRLTLCQDQVLSYKQALNAQREPAKDDRDSNVHETAICYRSMTSMLPKMPRSDGTPGDFLLALEGVKRAIHHHS